MIGEVFPILVICALAAGKSVPKKQISGGRIVGGNDTTILDNPWQVSLQYYGFPYCGGSVIAPNVILTAAHCAITVVPGLDVVVAGMDHLSQPGQEVGIKEAIVHQKYDDWTLDYDVGLLITSEPLVLSDSIQPANLPEQGDELEPGTPVRITGWGDTMSIPDFPDVLQSVTVPIVNPVLCNAAYEDLGGITDRMICAGLEEGGKDSCQGDSGGPLVYENTIQGIVSWGDGCAKAGLPGVYTKVSSVRDWIRQNVDV